MVRFEMEDLLKVALDAAEEASREILLIYSSDTFEVEMKADDSPLTLADRQAHDTIVRHLKKFTFPVLSEEGKEHVSYEERSTWKYYWLVDPLDGTKEFIKRNGEFTVNIALMYNNTPILGVVAVPVTGEIYYATANGGAYLKTSEGTRLLTKRQSVDLNKSGLRVVASRSHMNSDTERFIGALSTPELVSIGSSLKFMAVAKGVADIYPRFVPSMEWDIAASHVIINEIGLSITNAANKEHLSYNKKDLLNPSFICQ